jgi:hypothetical protein
VADFRVLGAARTSHRGPKKIQDLAQEATRWSLRVSRARVGLGCRPPGGNSLYQLDRRFWRVCASWFSAFQRRRLRFGQHLIAWGRKLGARLVKFVLTLPFNFEVGRFQVLVRHQKDTDPMALLDGANRVALFIQEERCHFHR